MGPKNVLTESFDRNVLTESFDRQFCFLDYVSNFLGGGGEGVREWGPFGGRSGVWGELEGDLAAGDVGRRSGKRLGRSVGGEIWACIGGRSGEISK